MARPTLQRNRKWPRLVRALGGQDALARGSLELLWDVAYESGDEHLGDSDDVELAARWLGQPGALTKALLEAGGPGEPGFIEPDPDRPGRYVVHDLWDHAPDYVRKRRARESERKEKGAKLRTVTGHCPPVDGHGPDDVRRAETGGVRPAPNGRPRAPAPTPQKEETLSLAQAREGEPELDPEAAGAVSPPTVEAVSGPGTTPHERTVETPREPETRAPASPGPQADDVDTAVTGTALPAAPPQAPASDPAPSPAGHSAEGDTLDTRTPLRPGQAAGDEGSTTAAGCASSRLHGAGTSGVETVPAEAEPAGRCAGEGGPPAPPAAANPPASTMAALRAERERKFKALAAVLQALEAESIVLTWPREPRQMNESATLLGHERSVEVIRRAHAKEPAPYGGYYALALYQAAEQERRRNPVPPPTPLPAGWGALAARLPPGSLSDLCRSTLRRCELLADGSTLAARPPDGQVAEALETYRAPLEREAEALGLALRILEPAAAVAAGGAP